MACTTGPTVAASLRAGMHTATVRPPLAAASDHASAVGTAAWPSSSPDVAAIDMLPSSLTGTRCATAGRAGAGSGWVVPH